MHVKQVVTFFLIKLRKRYSVQVWAQAYAQAYVFSNGEEFCPFLSPDVAITQYIVKHYSVGGIFLILFKI